MRDKHNRGSWVGLSGALILLLWGTFASYPARADVPDEGTWSLGYQTGVMTNQRAHEAINPSVVEFVDSYLLGVLAGYDVPIGESRFSFGIEFQANMHFGDQGFYEIVVPVVLRYHPEESWWDAFDSFSFGLGGSHYSEISNVERENYGESRRDLVYWFLEAEFATKNADETIFARIHHRSNAFDALEPNGGSNAFVVGFRRAF
ncbi:hypothetical protein CEP88_03675 [Roseobacter denitrificans]|uniref:Lipid A 3-O-deacylase n=1 Tax=Roseobacter denitrificans (strain ATCC 33942 / OCh 114) TaxID=375451 RepID=Q165N8_ROSDO|nr:hypothetical protein [Roseobacter denitrificans]ABG32305.1 hypothetical protein RD1_2774 [Roseobacter denitrificans OCh 114]AVL51788.1 hypothetical protein CEP88_03675 [Roseobacter denitrificans]